MALIRLRVCAGWSEPMLVAHTILLEISCRGSYADIGLRSSLLMFIVVKQLSSDVSILAHYRLSITSLSWFRSYLSTDPILVLEFNL